MEYSPEGRAYQAFLVGAKAFLMDSLYPKARDAVGDACRGNKSKDEAAEALRGNPQYEYFCWLEHYVQHFKYTARFGLVAEADRQRDRLVAVLDHPPKQRLTLSAADVPQYYSVVDTHQHPGNLHGDILAGPIYKASATTTQPGSTNAYGLHYLFADVLQRYVDKPLRILDLGCGFGKSALPIAQKWREAEVEGVDLSEGCLRLAAVEASDEHLDNLSYRQGDVADTKALDRSYDLVTSTMLLHELDNAALKDVMKEAYRVLAPGGHLVQLDFRARDPVEQFFLHGHGQRNNEPYMASFDTFDVEHYLKSVGFYDISIAPFEESPGATAPEFAKWRLPWTVIAARKPA
jgi:ubiquinone/menaquinone biosynthesis C-methylase UbiE